MPTSTSTSGLIERHSFFAYSGCIGTSEWGSETLLSTNVRPSSISLVRRTIQTGFERHSTVMIWPGSSVLMSASTGAPPALARSEGSQLAANGTAAATPAAPPAAQVAITRLRRPLLTFLTSLIEGSSIYKILLHAKAGDYTRKHRIY